MCFFRVKLLTFFGIMVLDLLLSSALQVIPDPDSSYMSFIGFWPFIDFLLLHKISTLGDEHGDGVRLTVMSSLMVVSPEQAPVQSVSAATLLLFQSKATNSEQLLSSITTMIN